MKKIYAYIRGSLCFIEIKEKSNGFKSFFINKKQLKVIYLRESTEDFKSIVGFDIDKAVMITVIDTIYDNSGILVPRWRYKLFLWLHKLRSRRYFIK